LLTASICVAGGSLFVISAEGEGGATGGGGAIVGCTSVVPTDGGDNGAGSTAEAPAGADVGSVGSSSFLTSCVGGVDGAVCGLPSSDDAGTGGIVVRGSLVAATGGEPEVEKSPGSTSCEMPRYAPPVVLGGAMSAAGIGQRRESLVPALSGAADVCSCVSASTDRRPDVLNSGAGGGGLLPARSGGSCHSAVLRSDAFDGVVGSAIGGRAELTIRVTWASSAANA